jgi:hypothetical protein
MGFFSEVTREELREIIFDKMDPEYAKFYKERQGLPFGRRGRGPIWEHGLFRAMGSHVGHYEAWIDPVAEICGRLDLTKVRPELEKLVGAKDAPEWFDEPPEDRIIYRFDDGFYVVRLVPSEMGVEGDLMRMCVGDPSQGYMRAVLNGDIWILSLRTPAGRPKLTFEVALEDGQPHRIKQIKGKANRLPGWDLGKAPRAPVRRTELAKQKIKLDEVLKAIEVTEALELDPRDVYDLGPAIMHLRTIKQLRELGKPALQYGPLQYEEIEEIMELIGAPRRNPSHQSRGTTFDQPYRPLR